MWWSFVHLQISRISGAFSSSPFFTFLLPYINIIVEQNWRPLFTINCQSWYILSQHDAFKCSAACMSIDLVALFFTIHFVFTTHWVHHCFQHWLINIVVVSILSLYSTVSVPRNNLPSQVCLLSDHKHHRIRSCGVFLATTPKGKTAKYCSQNLKSTCLDGVEQKPAGLITKNFQTLSRNLLFLPNSHCALPTRIYSLTSSSNEGLTGLFSIESHPFYLLETFTFSGGLVAPLNRSTMNWWSRTGISMRSWNDSSRTQSSLEEFLDNVMHSSRGTSPFSFLVRPSHFKVPFFTLVLMDFWRM